MDIISITTQEQFSGLIDWNQLDCWTFGPLADLPVDADDDVDALRITALAAVENGEVIGYLTADGAGVWCVEVKPEHRGRGIARALVVASNVRRFCECCSDDGVALAEAMGFEYEDCR